ncbi:CAAX protease [Rathayibacter sp. VKM Ac-2760]|nr:CAAX protease [Rathayibacter sp. VKM Ac-2760]
MAAQLTRAHGVDWYSRTDLLDDETLTLIAQAWRTGRLARLAAAPDVVQGKLVATLMFGFWVKILGRGGYHGEEPMRERRIYDTLLWKPALRHAFPHAGALDRATVEKTARPVQSLRNRIAHHEHIVWGVPLAGEKRPDGSTVRLSLGDAHGALLDLAGYVATDLRDWLEENSGVGAVLAQCPVTDHSRFLL